MRTSEPETAKRETMASKKSGKHLFIDTNVLLNFFAYSKDDLEQLEKIVKLIEVKSIKLYVTQQVVDEFYRNREHTLAQSFNTFRQKSIGGCPVFMNSFKEFVDYKKAIKEYEKAHSSLLTAGKLAAETAKLPADTLFASLIEKAKVIEIDNEAFDKAQRRQRRGNPPGKSAQIGDELNWEILLTAVPEDSDLHIVTRDGDYASELDPSEPKAFLAREWKDKVGGTLLLYEQLGQFFSKQLPDEEFSLEIEKKEAIAAVINSGNFQRTHSAVALLKPYIPFMTDEEVEELIQGSLYNSQVSWIMSDSDVGAFFVSVLKEHGGNVSARLKNRLEEGLGIKAEGEKGEDESGDKNDEESEV